MRFAIRYDFDLDDAQAAIKLDFKSTKHFELIISTCFLKFVTFYTWILIHKGKSNSFVFTDFTKKANFIHQNNCNLYYLRVILYSHIYFIYFIICNIYNILDYNYELNTHYTFIMKHINQTAKLEAVIRIYHVKKKARGRKP
jgi:hypothetical protein